MKKMIIVGAGGMGREVLQWVKDINQVKMEWEILGFLDDNPQALDGKACDYRIIGEVSNWQVHSDEFFVVAVSTPKIKEKVVNILSKRGAHFATIVHPSARIGNYNEIGEGTVIYPGASLSVNIKIGRFVTLLGSAVGHDAVIEDFASIMGMCSINGNVRIGKRAFLGCQTVTIPGRSVCEDAYVCAGSVVMTNIKKGYKVMGYPAKLYEF